MCFLDRHCGGTDDYNPQTLNKGTETCIRIKAVSFLRTFSNIDDSVIKLHKTK